MTPAELDALVAEVRRLRVDRDAALQALDDYKRERIEQSEAQARRALAGHTAPPAVVLKREEHEALVAERDQLRDLLGIVRALADVGADAPADELRGTLTKIASKLYLADVEPPPDAALATARREALDEAAGVCDEKATTLRECATSFANLGNEFAKFNAETRASQAEHIAAAIRALATREKGGG